MGSFRFGRRVKLLPGFYINIGKTGISFSSGIKGLKYTTGKNGKRITFGIPKTGLYYTHKISNNALPKQEVVSSELPTISMKYPAFYIMDTNNNHLDLNNIDKNANHLLDAIIIASVAIVVMVIVGVFLNKNDFDFLFLISAPTIMFVGAIWRLIEFYKRERRIRNIEANIVLPQYKASEFWLIDDEVQDFIDIDNEISELYDDTKAIYLKGEKNKISLNQDGYSFDKRSNLGKELQNRLDYNRDNLIELERQKNFLTKLPQNRWKEAKEEWEKTRSVLLRISNNYKEACAQGYGFLIGFLVWFFLVFLYDEGNKALLQSSTNSLQTASFWSVLLFFIMRLVLKAKTLFPINIPASNEFPNSPPFVSIENVNQYVDNKNKQSKFEVINVNKNDHDMIENPISYNEDVRREQADVEIYYQACNQFGTNFRNIWDYQSTEYNSKDDQYRFEILKGIVESDYDVLQIVEGYKIDYIQNVEKPYVVDTIQQSIILLIEYFSSNINIPNQPDVNNEKSEIIKSVINLKKLSEITLQAVSKIDIADRNKIPIDSLLDILLLWIKVCVPPKKNNHNNENEKDFVYQAKGVKKTTDRQTILRNPWEDILREKNFYVLDTDKEMIDEFNRRVSKEFIIQTDLPPEPYIGNPFTADIFLLALNPGFAGNEQEYMQKNPALHQVLLNNLIHKNIEYPLFFLDSQFSDSPGAKWWSRILNPLLSRVDNNKILLAKKICELQYFPYHSKSYKSVNGNLPSQQYTFDLLRKAISQNKMIILLRSEKLWLNAVPELKGKYLKLNSYQNVILSENNIGVENFKQLINKIKE